MSKHFTTLHESRVVKYCLNISTFYNSTYDVSLTYIKKNKENIPKNKYNILSEKKKNAISL